MQQIANWSTRRSGGAMTVTGVDAQHGGEVKLTSVTEVSVDEEGRILAVDKGGDRYRLTAARQSVEG